MKERKKVDAAGRPNEAHVAKRNWNLKKKTKTKQKQG